MKKIPIDIIHKILSFYFEDVIKQFDVVMTMMSAVKISSKKEK